MARSSRTSILKRQRELRKAEKAAEKRARRHGKPLPGQSEPRATVSLVGGNDASAGSDESPAPRGRTGGIDPTA